MTSPGNKYFEYTEVEMENLFTALYPRLRMYISRILAGFEHDMTEDIIQEIFYILLKRRPYVAKEKIASYIFTMAHNTCYNHIKRNKILYNNIDIETLSSTESLQQLFAYDFYENPGNSPIHNMLIEDVLSLCDKLPTKTARVFRMSRIEGMTNRQIAKALGITQSTVEKHISKSIKQFRTMTSYDKHM